MTPPPQLSLEPSLKWILFFHLLPCCTYFIKITTSKIVYIINVLNY